jgi:hypothetical protein
MLDYRDELLAQVEEGNFDAHHLLLCCLKRMSQQEIRDMLEANEIDLFGDPEEEPE